RVELEENKAVTTRLFTPKAIHWYNGAVKEEFVVPWPKDRSFLGQTPSLGGWFRRPGGIPARVGEGLAQQAYWVFAGLPPRDVAKHFRLRLVKEDDRYIYLEGTPRSEPARVTVTSARVVLMRKDFRVRQFWYEHPNGNST